MSGGTDGGRADVAEDDGHHPLRQRSADGAVLPQAIGRRSRPPGLVAVDGVTIDGAKVSAGGRSLTGRRARALRATVAPLSGDDAVVIRLEHPRTGVHYYVRQPGARHRGRLAHAR